jgi:hypothetical protein
MSLLQKYTDSFNKLPSSDPEQDRILIAAENAIRNSNLDTESPQAIADLVTKINSARDKGLSDATESFSGNALALSDQFADIIENVDNLDSITPEQIDQISQAAGYPKNIILAVASRFSDSTGLQDDIVEETPTNWIMENFGISEPNKTLNDIIPKYFDQIVKSSDPRSITHYIAQLEKILNDQKSSAELNEAVARKLIENTASIIGGLDYAKAAAGPLSRLAPNLIQNVVLKGSGNPQEKMIGIIDAYKSLRHNAQMIQNIGPNPIDDDSKAVVKKAAKQILGIKEALANSGLKGTTFTPGAAKAPEAPKVNPTVAAPSTEPKITEEPIPTVDVNSFDGDSEEAKHTAYVNDQAARIIKAFGMADPKLRNQVLTSIAKTFPEELTNILISMKEQFAPKQSHNDYIGNAVDEKENSTAEMASILQESIRSGKFESLLGNDTFLDIIIPAATAVFLEAKMQDSESLAKIKELERKERILQLGGFGNKPTKKVPGKPKEPKNWKPFKSDDED